MNNTACEFCEKRENGSNYCIGHKTIIVCCGYPNTKKEKCLVYQLKIENQNLQKENKEAKELLYFRDKLNKVLLADYTTLQNALKEINEIIKIAKFHDYFIRLPAEKTFKIYKKINEVLNVETN